MSENYKSFQRQRQQERAGALRPVCIESSERQNLSTERGREPMSAPKIWSVGRCCRDTDCIYHYEDSYGLNSKYEDLIKIDEDETNETSQAHKRGNMDPQTLKDPDKSL